MLVAHGPTGVQHDFFAFDASGNVWNGSAFVPWVDGSFATYRITATEIGTIGRYTGVEPTATHTWELRIRGATAADSTLVDSDYFIPTASVGTGARTVNITVNDGTDPVSLANVRLTKGLESYVQQTNASGLAVFNVDDGTWIVAIAKAGFQFGGTSLVVDSTETVTYSMTPLLIAAASPNMTVGYLTVYNEEGDPEQGVVISAVAYLLPTGSMGIAPDATPFVATSDAVGLAQFDALFKGLTYQFYRGNTKKKTVTIPTTAGATYELPSIIGKP